MVEKKDTTDDAEGANVVDHEPSVTQETLPGARQHPTDYAKGSAWGTKDTDSPQAIGDKDEAMQEEIPGWTVHWDEPTGHPFYENKKTQLSYWEHPMRQANPVKVSSAASPSLAASKEANTTNVVYWESKLKESEKETRQYLDRIAQLEVESFQLQLDEYLDLMNSFVRAEKANEKKPERIDEVREMFKDEVRETIKVARILMHDTRRTGVISEDKSKWLESLKQVLERMMKLESFQRRLGQYLNLLNTFVSQHPDFMKKFMSDGEANEKWPEQKVKLALAVESIRTSKMIEEASILMEDATKNGVISWAMQRRFDGLGQQLETIMKTVYSESRSAGL